MNNILVRSLSGVLFVAVVIGAFFIGELATGVILGLFMVLGLGEFYRLFIDVEDINPHVVPALFTALMGYSLLLGNQMGWWYLNPMLVFIPISFLFYVNILREKSRFPVKNLAVTGMGFLYVFLPFSVMLFLYGLNSSNDDWYFLLGLFLIVWSNDTFAYLTGRFLGKHKLFERVSPKKTWEGTIGGFIFAVLAGGAYAYFTDHDYLFWVVGAVIISPAAVVGDLIESQLKRTVGVKDSGNIMPGHGGILDRFDAVMFAAPFFYVWCQIY
ncbi:MAG: phosphatidate cytidylyltransferase [Brumimicrobium sp.]|nr:phosphatidate cytidylyltransferase [Brumimicrobium sp.]